jgi:hypothetical protein
MRRFRWQVRLFAYRLILGIACASVSVSATSAAGADRARAASAPRADSAGPTPFARVYLALRGCTSCSHCRTTIRQMVRSQAGKAGEARVDGGAVELAYRKPGVVPLRKVIRSLAENRLHDLSLVDVLFEVDGTITTGGEGAARFTLRGTRQSFPLHIDRAVRRPPDGAPVRLTALVEGWREGGELSLVARQVRAGSHSAPAPPTPG